MSSTEKGVAARAWNKVERFIILPRRLDAVLREHFRFGRPNSQEYKPCRVCLCKTLEALGNALKLVCCFHSSCKVLSSRIAGRLGLLGTRGGPNEGRV